MNNEREFKLRHRHAIVAGYGPVGRLVAEQLESAGLRVTIIDLNTTTHERQQKLDKAIVLGDIRDPEVLKAADIAHADALILTVPDEEIVCEACAVARQLHPDTFIAARTNFVSRGLRARQLGADALVIEELVTAEAMRDVVMNALTYG